MRIEAKNGTPIWGVSIKQRFSNLDRAFVPSQLKKGFHPIAAAPDSGTGTFEIHNVFSQHSMVTFLKEDYTVEELYAFFFEPKLYAVYTMDTTEGALHKWNTLKSKLPAGNIQHVFLKSSFANSQQFLDFVRKFKEENPKINIFAGVVETAECAERVLHAGADIVVVDTECLETLDEMVDVSKIHTKGVAFVNKQPHPIRIPLGVGVDFVLMSFDFYEESAGPVEVATSGTYKNSKKFGGSVLKAVEMITAHINEDMHRVGARDMEHFVQRVIFVPNSL